MSYSENYIYVPAVKSFRCRVPLKGTQQQFLSDGVLQGSGKPFAFEASPSAVMDEILQLISIRNSTSKLDLEYSLDFIFGENSISKLVLCSHTMTDDPFKTTENVNIRLHKGANANIVLMQNEGNNSLHTFNYNIEMDQGSTLEMVFITLHGGKITNNIRVEMNGKYERCDLSGLYFMDREQTLTNNITMRHNSPECSSSQLFKGILDDSAKAYFNGAIYVAPESQKTEAFQANHNLLVSQKARVKTEPQLEIYADDVKCSHGATVGQLNQDELFYMRSRGIPYKEALILQQSAFAYAVLEKIEKPELRERMANLIDKRLRGEFSRCSNCSKNCC